MNDKELELLKLAAKAAGNDYKHDNSFWAHEDHCAYWSYADLCTCGGRWNPLTDDGDALRLAVNLDIDVAKVQIKFWDKHSINPYAATRRAIVRAAAEIGKEMK